MPVRHARSETRGRPPCGRRDGIGKNGSTRSHNASGSSAAAIPLHVTAPKRSRCCRFGQVGLLCFREETSDGSNYLRPYFRLRIDELEVAAVGKHGRVQHVARSPGGCFIRRNLRREHSTGEEFLAHSERQELNRRRGVIPLRPLVG